MTVVADVHTNPIGPGSSLSDRTNSMISLTWLIALIVPRFAEGTARPCDLGVHVYQSNYQWEAHIDSGLIASCDLPMRGMSND